ncbi:hypothetical protein Dimus_019778 [Dionaea muscipula]
MDSPGVKNSRSARHAPDVIGEDELGMLRPEALPWKLSSAMVRSLSGEGGCPPGRRLVARMAAPLLAILVHCSLGMDTSASRGKGLLLADHGCSAKEVPLAATIVIAPPPLAVPPAREPAAR